MSTTALSAPGIRQDGIISVDSVRQNRDAIQKLLSEVLVEGIDRDYATIPGTKKKTLLKPGSEKILSMFGIAVEPIVEAIRDGDDITYRVTARLSSIASGIYLGSGIGEASTLESKYAWRAAICDEEFDAADPHRRRIHWQKGYNNGPVASVKQVRENANDKMNTVLKMAKKRAQIDGTLTVTAASDTFTQDIEGTLERNAGKSTAPVSGNQVSAAMAEAVITPEQSKKFFGTWKNVGKHSKENVVLYLQRHCGGITDDRKMPARCYPDAIKWAATEGAPVPEAKVAPKAEAKPPVVIDAQPEDPERKKVDQLFGILGVDLAAQAALLTEYAGRMKELAAKLEFDLERE